MVGEREVTGTASRLHFYPADSDKEEDSQVEEQNISIQCKMITIMCSRLGISGRCPELRQRSC